MYTYLYVFYKKHVYKKPRPQIEKNAKQRRNFWAVLSDFRPFQPMFIILKYSQKVIRSLWFLVIFYILKS